MADRKLPKTLTREEMDALLARPNLDAPTGLRNRCLLELMYRSGLRVSEATGLHLRDVKWADNQIHIRSAVAKGGREAYVYLHPTSQELLERWKAIRRRHAAGAPELLITLRGTPVGRKYVWEMVSRYARRAGIDRPVWPHVLRHTFATELLREGFNIREVQVAMRHADIRTTSIYTEISDEQLGRRLRGR